MERYLPGCDVRKNHPEAILKIENYMKHRNVIIEKCCRVEGQFLNPGDRIIQNCTLCELMLKESHPENACLSLYEYVLTDPNFPWPDHQGEVITVQDCWRTRHNRSLQNAIRQCLEKMHYTIVEMDKHHQDTQYCGVWLNNKPMMDCVKVAPNTMKDIIDHHIDLLPEDKQVEKMQEWVKNYQTDQILVYCNGCEKGIRLGGKKAIHMVELLAENLI